MRAKEFLSKNGVDMVVVDVLNDPGGRELLFNKYGLRKVPDNVPNKEMLEQHLGKPLTQVPDPFDTHPSFGEHNNVRLRAFLDHFGFDYEFMSSTDCYKSGRFDQALLRVLARFDEVMAIMLPSLREERATTYSPFLPIDAKTGIVLQVPVIGHDAKAGTIIYEDPDTKKPVTTPVTGGGCKLQWKPDWAMRWVALGVDYNIFLIARAREETIAHGSEQGILRALAVTGAVITSAGIVLAGTFSVLAVLPLTFLTELGFVVAFGVLLDTFLVRSVLVPAIALTLGDKFWWPSALSRASEGREPSLARTQEG